MDADPALRTREIRHVGPTARATVRFRELLKYRELLANLVRKELKVKYKNSALGFVWSMLNPAMYLAIFYIVFSFFLQQGLPNFVVFLLSGLLAWNLFSTGMSGTTGSIAGNSSLVSKVYFPREVLPLASIGASLVHFFLQFSVLVAALAIFRYSVGFELFLLPAALIVLLVLLVGFGLLLSSLNVYMRDIQHLLELLLLAWFWMTPIIYPVSIVQDKLGGKALGGISAWAVYLLNPMTPIVLAFQRGLYGDVSVARPDGTMRSALVSGVTSAWYAKRLAYVFIGGIILLLLAWRLFRKLESNLAEEL